MMKRPAPKRCRAFTFETGDAQQETSDMQAVVLTFDRLAASVLGCYGNEWIETPHLDRFAAQGIVFDSHFADGVGPLSGESLLTGRRHDETGSRTTRPSVADWSDWLKLAGIRIDLIREQEALPWSKGLKTTSVQEVIANPDESQQPDRVPFALAVQAACERLSQPCPEQHRLTWIHSAGVPEPWSPPEGFATLYFEDFEERGYPLGNLPRSTWGTSPAVYAGAVSLLDHWVGQLLEAIHPASRNEPVLVVIAAAQGVDWLNAASYLNPRPRKSTSSRKTDSDSEETDGSSTVASQVDPATSDSSTVDSILESEPSGEDRSPSRLGAINEESVHAPLMMSLFNEGAFARDHAGTRSFQLVQPLDLPATLIEHFGLPAAKTRCDGLNLLKLATSREPARSQIRFGNGSDLTGVRSWDWNCLVQRDGSVAADAAGESNDKQMDQPSREPIVKLFRKPEDTFDVNDESRQQPDVITALTGVTL